MRWGLSAVFFAVIVCAIFPSVSAATLTINASPQQAHFGDIVTLSGTVSGVSTIAVYVFIVGPGLDARGVTLENLNIAAGRGLFTTAPVNLSTGCWTYRWDTSVIIGTVGPGTYTVYAVTSPVDRLRYQKGDYATAEIEFLPGNEPATPAPLDPVVPVVATGIGAMVCVCVFRMREKRG